MRSIAALAAVCLGISTGVISAHETAGGQTMLALPENVTLSSDSVVSVDLPTAAFGKSITLKVTLEPEEVGPVPFMVNACLDEVCGSFEPNALDNLAFFPPPKQGQEREFVVQIPAELTADKNVGHQLVLSLRPLASTIGHAATPPKAKVAVKQVTVIDP